MVTRRHFLSAGVALAAASTFGRFFQIASAQPKGPAQNLIIVFNYGGWDPTLVFDPKEPSTTVNVAQGRVKQYNDLSIWTDSTRPAIDTYFQRWGSISAVVNGIAVRSLVHEECVEQVLTGVSLEKKPDIGAVIASKLKEKAPVPYLTLGAQAQPRELAPLAAEFGFTNQLSSLAVPDYAYPKLGSQEQHHGFGPSKDEQQWVKQYLSNSQADYAKNHGKQGRNGKRIDDFANSSQRADRLATFLNHSSIAEPKVVFRFSEKYPMAVQALQENFSNVVFMQTDGWDTHSNVAQQEPMMNDLFTGLNGLMNSLHKNKMLDSTMVLVLSEMGRTPRMNNEKGKDHWPFTSAMLVGGAVRGGHHYGVTDPELYPLPIDLKTGKATKSGGTSLRTTHLLSAVMKLMGLDPATHFHQKDMLQAVIG